MCAWDRTRTRPAPLNLGNVLCWRPARIIVDLARSTKTNLPEVIAVPLFNASNKAARPEDESPPDVTGASLGGAIGGGGGGKPPTGGGGGAAAPP